jgi:cytochrome c553
MSQGLGIALVRSAVLVFGITGGSLWSAGPAGAQVVKPAASEDFRAVYATPQEISQGKRIADTSCARCHGPGGVSTAKGVPHLAGQRAVYLHQELLAYKKGARGKNMMAEAVAFLSDDALLKVAAWYASLDPAAPAPAPGTKAAVASTDPLSAGKATAAGCGSCHGETGVSAIPGMPSLVGLDPKYLVAATNAYRNGQRKHDLMKALVAGLSDADIENVALFYASQKPARAKTPAPGNKAAGKAAAAACAGCHGEAGISAGTTPSLAGQDAQYFVAAMRAYQDGSRADPLMKGAASAMAESGLADLAAHYASLQPQPPKVARALSTSDWADRCDRCHGVNGNSTDPRVPALAAQRAEYIEAILNAYRTGSRSSQAMSAMSKVLTEADVRQLADHYSRQKARAVVYVQLPPKGKPR